MEVIKSWANAIATVAALVAGTAAVTKPEDPAPKVSYDELRKAVEKNSEDNLRNHEDVAAMRAFLDGYTRAQQAPPVPSASAPRAPASRGSVRAMTPPAPSAPPPLPELHRPQEATKLPEYGSKK